jgi:hypothetical protein
VDVLRRQRHDDRLTVLIDPDRVLAAGQELVALA